MKSHILLAIAVGAVVGSLATFFVMRDSGTTSYAAIDVRHSSQSVDEADRDTAADPFEASKDPETGKGESHYPIKKMDMTKPIQRDICISFWYLGMRSVVDTLETQTGHKFKPVAKLSAGPVEILEEQAVFMKEFLAETERLGKNE